MLGELELKHYVVVTILLAVVGALFNLLRGFLDGKLEIIVLVPIFVIILFLKNERFYSIFDRR